MQVLGHWDLGFYTCLVWTGSDVTLSTASIMHLCAIALHRYHGIAHPLRMRSTSENRRVAALVAPAWSIAVALSVPLVVQGVFDRDHVLAPLDPSDGRSLSCGIFNRTFAVYSSLVSFFIPLAVMIVADFRSVQILRKNIQFPAVASRQSSLSRRRSRRLRQALHRESGNDDADDDETAEVDRGVTRTASSDATSTVSVALPEVCVPRPTERKSEDITPATDAPVASVDAAAETPPFRSSFVYRGRSRSKSMVYIDMLASCGRSTKVNSRERRAEKTLIWVFAAFVALWLPFFCANLAYGACGGDGGPCDVPPHLFAVFTWLGYASSGVNPCIYTLLNRDFRFAFRHLLTCRLSRLRAANASATATLRVNSVRFARTSSTNGWRTRRPDTDPDGSGGMKIVVTPSFP